MAQARTAPQWAKEYSVTTAGSDLTLDEIKGLLDASKVLGFDGRAVVRATAGSAGSVTRVQLLQPLVGADNL
jgi:hypothetical protein